MRNKIFISIFIVISTIAAYFLYSYYITRNTPTNYYIKKTSSKSQSYLIEIDYSILDSISNNVSFNITGKENTLLIDRLYDSNTHFIQSKFNPFVSDSVISKIASIVVFNSLLRPYGMPDSSINGCALNFIKIYSNIYSVISSPYLCCSDFTLLTAKQFQRNNYNNTIVNLNFHALNLIRIGKDRTIYVDATSGIIYDKYINNTKLSIFYYLPIYGTFNNKFHRSSIIDLRGFVAFLLFDPKNLEKHFLYEETLASFEKQYFKIE